MILYKINASIKYDIGGITRNVQAPTFFISQELQGVVGIEHAKRIAENVLLLPDDPDDQVGEGCEVFIDVIEEHYERV